MRSYPIDEPEDVAAHLEVDDARFADLEANAIRHAFVPKVEGFYPIARALADLALGTGPVAVTAGETGAFRPFEDPFLLRLYFMAAGCPGGRFQGCCIVYEREEAEALAACLHLILLAKWEVQVLGHRARFQIEIDSHDRIELHLAPEIDSYFTRNLQAWIEDDG